VKKLLGLVMVGMLSLGVAGPAYADHGGRRGGGNGGGDGECGRNGGCNNERDEDYSHAQCKYACPNFDKSPVHDAFNFAPFICMPGATCYQKDPKDKDEQSGQPDQGQEPASMSEPNPACIISVPFHCDPSPRQH
jgi:hypothetical protein